MIAGRVRELADERGVAVLSDVDESLAEVTRSIGDTGVTREECAVEVGDSAGVEDGGERRLVPLRQSFVGELV